jgi:hypothetical protein
LDTGFFSTVLSDTVGEKNKKLIRGRVSAKKSLVLFIAQTKKDQNPMNHQ